MNKYYLFYKGSDGKWFNWTASTDFHTVAEDFRRYLLGWDAACLADQDGVVIYEFRQY